MYWKSSTDMELEGFRIFWGSAALPQAFKSTCMVQIKDSHYRLHHALAWAGRHPLCAGAHKKKVSVRYPTAMQVYLHEGGPPSPPSHASENPLLKIRCMSTKWCNMKFRCKWCNFGIPGLFASFGLWYTIYTTQLLWLKIRCTFTRTLNTIHRRVCTMQVHLHGPADSPSPLCKCKCKCL